MRRELDVSARWEAESHTRRNYAEICFSIPSSQAAVITAVESVRRLLQLLGVEDEWVFRSELSLQEALLNSHFHGNRGNSRQEIRIFCNLSPIKVEIQVEDNGPGYKRDRNFNGDNGTDGHGRGLFLIHQMMDFVAVNDKGNQIVMSLFKE